ncbi:S-methyl-5-thioribose-1-phosphate isomerase [Balneolaceae bacterium ANBcel3]|nr:S-methyl-5-thioribose-1-phosphate isomerase [Balneolaceae bacterium ANBcel3]
MSHSAIIPQSLVWKNAFLEILDQTQLPGKETYISLYNPEEVREAILALKVRGAPAIGIAAAYGLCLVKPDQDSELDYIERLEEAYQRLSTSRPTAVNLNWALKRMMRVLETLSSDISPVRIHQALIAEAERIHEEDKRLCQLIGENGRSLIPDQAHILTHCNTGSLATGQFGTALSVIYHAHLQGKNPHVWVDETRPLLQGSRLTAWELMRAGICHTVITDSMAAWVMKKKKVDIILTGADRVTQNGDTANKIGTYALSVLAKHHGIPFYVALPSSTYDHSLSHGDDIPIEERDATEVRSTGNTLTTPVSSPVFNPAFDITPGRFITGFITEKGVLYPPYEQSLPVLADTSEK